MGGGGDDDVWLGAHGAGPGRGGDGTDAPRSDSMAGHGDRGWLTLLACHAGGGVWKHRTGRGREACAGRGPDARGHNGGALVGGGTASASRGAVVGSVDGERRGGGSLFSPGSGHCPSSGGESVRAPGRREPHSPLAAAMQAG